MIGFAWASLSRRSAIALVVLAAVLIALRAALPVAIERYVNRVLDEDPAYEGRIDDVDVALIRGAYTIERIEIQKSNGRVPVPLFSCDQIDLSIQWRALFDGALVGEIYFERPQINLVASESRAQQQTGAEVDWRDKVEKLFPVRINRAEVRDGSVHLRAFHTDPRVDVYLHELDAIAINLTNSSDLSGDRVAQVTMRAVPMNAGLLRARASLDPFSERPDFDLDAEAKGIDLAQWNDLLRAYLKFDVEDGAISLYTELAARGDRFDGYLKPFVEGVDVLRYEEERKEQSFFASIWEGLVGATAELFQDQSHDRVATRIPISGSVEDPRIGFWPTLGNVVRNAFIEALVPQLERSVGDR